MKWKLGCGSVILKKIKINFRLPFIKIWKWLPLQKADWPKVNRQIYDSATRSDRQTEGQEGSSHYYLPSRPTACAPGWSQAPARHSASPWPSSRLQSRSLCGKTKRGNTAQREEANNAVEFWEYRLIIQVKVRGFYAPEGCLGFKQSRRLPQRTAPDCIPTIGEGLHYAVQYLEHITVEWQHEADTLCSLISPNQVLMTWSGVIMLSIYSSRLF